MNNYKLAQAKAAFQSALQSGDTKRIEEARDAYKAIANNTNLIVIK